MVSNLKHSRNLSYAASRYEDTPIRVSDFVGTTVDIWRIVWHPTGAGTPRWIASADAPGFEGIQIELFGEHANRLNRVLRLGIFRDCKLDVEFQGIIERWSPRRGFTGIGAVWTDEGLVWLAEDEPEPNEQAVAVKDEQRRAQALPRTRQRPFQQSKPQSRPTALQALSALQAALLEAPYPVRRNVHEIQITGATEYMAGVPLVIRIELTPNADKDTVMTVIEQHDTSGFEVRIIEQPPRYRAYTGGWS